MCIIEDEEKLKGKLDFETESGDKHPWASAGFCGEHNNMNELVDTGANVIDITRRVNGGINGLSERDITI